MNMDKQKFERILATHGGNPDAWPETERAVALNFSVTDPQAAIMLREARALHTLIGELPDIDPSPDLTDRIIAAAVAQNQTANADMRQQGRQSSILTDYRQRMRRLREGLWPFGPLWRPAAGLAAPALFGLLLGLYQPQLIATTAPTATTATVTAITLTSTAETSTAETSTAGAVSDNAQAPAYDLTELAFASLDPLDSFVIRDASFLPAPATWRNTQQPAQQRMQHSSQQNATIAAPVATADDKEATKTDSSDMKQTASPPSPDPVISAPAAPAIPALPQPGRSGAPGSALGFSPSGSQGGWR